MPTARRSTRKGTTSRTAVRRPTASVCVVTGPPCSGKSTYIAEHAKPGELVVDLDAIARTLGYPSKHIDWAEDVPHPARVAAMRARASVLKAIADGSVSGRVWLVDLLASPEAQARVKQLGARVVRLDPGPDECHRRATADGRNAATHAQIDSWYGSLGVTSQTW